MYYAIKITAGQIDVPNGYFSDASGTFLHASQEPCERAELLDRMKKTLIQQFPGAVITDLDIDISEISSEEYAVSKKTRLV